jgi:hypothetical protein
MNVKYFIEAIIRNHFARHSLTILGTITCITLDLRIVSFINKNYTSRSKKREWFQIDCRLSFCKSHRPALTILYVFTPKRPLNESQDENSKDWNRRHLASPWPTLDLQNAASYVLTSENLWLWQVSALLNLNTTFIAFKILRTWHSNAWLPLTVRHWTHRFKLQ